MPDRKLVFVALLLLASGCPISPKYVRPDVPLPPNWSASTDPRLAAKTAVDVAWWHSFNDPALDRLDRHRLSAEPAAADRRACASSRRAPSSASPSDSSIRPTRAPSAARRSTGSASTTPPPATSTSSPAATRSASTRSGRSIFWGKYRRGVKAAKATYLATVADYDDALVALDRRGRAHLRAHSHLPGAASS